jgi:hypothetical protein
MQTAKQFSVDHPVSMVVGLIGLVAFYTGAMNAGMLMRYNFGFVPLIVSGDLVTMASQGVIFALLLICVIGVGIMLTEFIPIRAKVADRLMLGVFAICPLAAIWFAYARFVLRIADMFGPALCILALTLIMAFLSYVARRRLTTILIVMAAIWSVLCAGEYGFWLAERRLAPETAKHADVYAEKTAYYNATMLFSSGSGVLIRTGENIIFIPIGEIERIVMAISKES